VEVWQEVDAAPPLNSVVPGVPWHPWQYFRSAFAVGPWNWLVVGFSHVAPSACGAAPTPWHSVLLKHPGAVPAGAGVAG
jgi:hypothetical protein